MTPLEVMDTVRMLLDDSRDWYPSTDMIVNVINDVQLLKIEKYNKEQDERALRPLYRFAFDASGNQLLSNNDIIYDANGNIANILYPKSCKILNSSTSSNWNPPYSTFVIANYVDSEVYYNFVSTQNPILNQLDAQVLNQTGEFLNNMTGSRFPRSAYYTIYSSWNSTTGQNENRLSFISPNSNNKASLLYIAYPQKFVYVDNNPAVWVPLSLPQEYHYEIASLAAEVLNRMDVEELERAESYAPNVKLTFEEINKT